MKLFFKAMLLGLLVVGACSKEKDVRTCNPKTLLIKFTCGDDLVEADKLKFRLSRNDGLTADLSTTLACPGSRTYEVAVSDYAQAQTFEITASPSKGDVAIGEPNILGDVTLAQGCSAVTFPLTAKGGRIVPTPDGDGGPTSEAGSEDSDAGPTIPVDRGSKEIGLACGAGPECMSGFCADGVCCDGACKGTCVACNLQGSMGQCKSTPSGQAPVTGKMCTSDEAASCGFDGKCNGEGECRKWPDGTVCAAGDCEGAGTRGRKSCKAGACSAANDLVCAPFACNATGVVCFNECASNGMCEAGKNCAIDADTNKQSCGKKPLAAVCTKAAECESNNCADGVCCSTACDGACRSCSLIGTAGECKNIPGGGDDAHGVCKGTDVAMCGQTGKCDGSGGCSRFSKGSVCLAAKCAGSDGVPASECDGNGSCVAGRPVACAPFTCGGNACLTKCTTDDQCAGGTSCVNGSCGLLPKGANCNGGTACASGFCVDGVCCDSACNGTCQFCATSTAKGTCTDVAAGGDDPRNKCAASVKTTCGNDGKCDGNKGCQKWAQGTECLARSCDSAANQESYAKQCDGVGTCAPVKQASACSPFICGVNACATTCSRDDQCVAPNTCVNGLCGKRGNGQVCGSATQCLSGVCAQGVCCGLACTGNCKSCAVAGKEGACSDVPAGQDPLNQCDALASTTCKTTGTCDGGGKCAVYASGVICAGATCSADASQEIGSSTCDGVGTCKAPAAIMCASNLVCSGANCIGSCAADADCRNGTKCNARTKQCGQANGQGCSGNGDCGSDKCADGFCCNSACTGSCESCSNAATGMGNGTCAPIPSGTNDGSCNPASCSGNSATPGATCNGARACTTPAAVSCGEFSCNAGSCLSTCSAQSPCSDPNKQCVNGQCKKNQGIACGSGAECASTFCPDGVCCNSSCNGACQACGSGTCNGVTSGTDQLCTVSTCGFTGQCTTGGCQTVAVGTQCAPPSCQNSSTQVAASTCGGGSCATPATTACAPGTCKGSACSPSCTSNGDCAANAYCNAGTCGTKLGNGASCSNSGQCSSANCIDGVCCNTGCGETCKSCSVAGLVGTCSNVPVGQDPRQVCADGACALGTCNGGGACSVSAAGTQCAGLMCSGTTIAVSIRTCNATGTCQPATTVTCSNGLCSGGTCASDCSAGCAVRTMCLYGKCEFIAGTQTDVWLAVLLARPGYALSNKGSLWADTRATSTAQGNANAYCKLIGYTSAATFTTQCIGDEQMGLSFITSTGQWEATQGGNNFGTCYSFVATIQCI